ncbi:MAG: GFA family protein [Pseudomonadota bacterium]
MASKTGSCLCGEVEYELAEEPTTYGACHCSMCRKFSGGIELGIQVPPGGVRFVPTDKLAVFESSEWAERGFCMLCGSSVFYRFTGEGPYAGMFSISAGTLEDMSGMTFDTEVYIDNKPDSHSFAGERTRMTEAEVLAAAGVETGGGE